MNAYRINNNGSTCVGQSSAAEKKRSDGGS